MDGNWVKAFTYAIFIVMGGFALLATMAAGALLLRALLGGG